MRELLAFAHITHRNLNHHDLVNMIGLPRDEAFLGPFVMPSASLFRDYCHHLIGSYGIRHVVRKAYVTGVECLHSEADKVGGDAHTDTDCGDSANPDNPQSDDHRTASNGGTARYKLKLGGGEILLAKRVVCALGPNLRQDGMHWEADLGTATVDYPPHRLVHSYEMSEWLRETASARRWGAYPRVVIVGGGITSAHVLRICLKVGAKITMLVRSELRERQFDIPKKWFGPRRGALFRAFDELSPTDRAQTVADARSGGSMPPECLKSVRDAEACGRVIVREGVEIYGAKWVGPVPTPAHDELDGAGDEAKKERCGHWELSLDGVGVNADTGRSIQCDLVLLACGADLDLEQYPVLCDLLAQRPVELINGLPPLTPSLAWAPDEEFYVTGARTESGVPAQFQTFVLSTPL